MNSEAKRRGRPPGSKNKISEIVVRIPAVCPSCRSTAIVQRDGARITVLDASGVLPDGTPFTAVRWVPSRCRNCGQCVTIKEPLVTPEK